MEDMEVPELYELRVLVFQEIEPQTNKYNQVILNQEQFKNVTNSIGNHKPEKDNELRDGFEMYETKLSIKEYDLPDLQSFTN